LNEAIELLAVRPGGVYIDGTSGSGGHGEAILERAGPDGTLLAIDRDEEALVRSRERLAHFGERCSFAHGNYADMFTLAEEAGLSQVDGVLMDLGVSSDQLDEAERGFSFARAGKLDMRMDRSQGSTAEDLVNDASEEELGVILGDLGEERSDRRIARAIVREREKERITQTLQLAAIIAKAKGGRRGRIDPATKSFQALRMYVNQEERGIKAGLDAALRCLKPGGRIAVISFHSIEDRIVKRFFAQHAGTHESLHQGGSRWVGEWPPVSRITRKPVCASAEEIEENPRSRSAKLRVAELRNEPEE